jgi:hypothetical protein
MTGDNAFTYPDGQRSFTLPPEWQPLDPRVRDLATERALEALGEDGLVIDRLRRYYDPAGQYAGNLLSELGANPDTEITPDDLLAVGMLSMKIRPSQVRALTGHGSELRKVAHTHLTSVKANVPITALDVDADDVATTRRHMWDLYDTFRTAGGAKNRWVFAAKLCARKRPHLFPVRDNEVCRYLAGGAELTREGMGQFSNDMQVFAWLMGLPAVDGRLRELRAELSASGLEVDRSDLRLLDTALWTAAVTD